MEPFFPAIDECAKERMGGKALVAARPQRMVAGGGGLQQGRTGTRLDSTHSFKLAISREKRCYNQH